MRRQRRRTCRNHSDGVSVQTAYTVPPRTWQSVIVRLLVDIALAIFDQLPAPIASTAFSRAQSSYQHKTINQQLLMSLLLPPMAYRRREYESSRLDARHQHIHPTLSTPSVEPALSNRTCVCCNGSRHLLDAGATGDESGDPVPHVRVRLLAQTKHLHMRVSAGTASRRRRRDQRTMSSSLDQRPFLMEGLTVLM